MALWVKTLATNLEGLGSIPCTHIKVETEHQQNQVAL